MTTAEKIAELLNNDGQRFETDDGRSLASLCSDENATVEWRDGYRTGDVVRYLFSDDSAITVTGEAWDLGYANCFCWRVRGNDHRDECEQGFGIYCPECGEESVVERTDGLATWTACSNCGWARMPDAE